MDKKLFLPQCAKEGMVVKQTCKGQKVKPIVRLRKVSNFTGDILIRDDNEHFEIILPKVQEIRGKLNNGVLVSGTIFFKDDHTKLIGDFHHNCLDGVVKLYTENYILMAIGMYENGVPHGPFWVVPWIPGSQYMFLHFVQGQLIPANTVVLDTQSRFAMMGTLVNGSILDTSQLIGWYKFEFTYTLF